MHPLGSFSPMEPTASHGPNAACQKAALITDVRVICETAASNQRGSHVRPVSPNTIIADGPRQDGRGEGVGVGMGVGMGMLGRFEGLR